MKIKLLLSCLLLTGCSDVIKSESIELAIKLCKDRQGIDYIYNSTNNTSVEVKCKNGENFYLNKQVISLLKGESND